MLCRYEGENKGRLFCVGGTNCFLSSDALYEFDQNKLIPKASMKVGRKEFGCTNWPNHIAVAGGISGYSTFETSIEIYRG